MHEAYTDMPLDVPCGRCIGCKITKARGWAMRCVHEASLHDDNCFITLTYKDPAPDELVVQDLQLFFKRLRKRIGKFRYFAVGEYGEKFDRPHYHALIFGYDFKDKKYWSGPPEKRSYTSALLDKTWQMGKTEVGDLTPASAHYVARYCVKKLTGPMAPNYYQGRKPEFAVMSKGRKKGEGIGGGWIKKFKSSVFPRDFVVVKGGQKVAVPRYYLDQMNEDEQRRIKTARSMRERNEDEERSSRAIVVAEVKRLNLEASKRRFENA